MRNDDYEDPDSRIDSLPQPYRMINKVLNRFLDSVLDKLVSIERETSATQYRKQFESIKECYPTGYDGSHGGQNDLAALGYVMAICQTEGTLRTFISSSNNYIAEICHTMSPLEETIPSTVEVVGSIKLQCDCILHLCCGNLNESAVLVVAVCLTAERVVILFYESEDNEFTLLTEIFPSYAETTPQAAGSKRQGTRPTLISNTSTSSVKGVVIAKLSWKCEFLALSLDNGTLLGYALPYKEWSGSTDGAPVAPTNSFRGSSFGLRTSTTSLANIIPSQPTLSFRCSLPGQPDLPRNMIASIMPETNGSEIRRVGNASFHFVLSAENIPKDSTNPCTNNATSTIQLRTTTICAWWRGCTQVLWFSIPAAQTIPDSVFVRRPSDFDMFDSLGTVNNTAASTVDGQLILEGVWSHSCEVTTSTTTMSTSLVAVGLIDGSVVLWERQLLVESGICRSTCVSSVSAIHFIERLVPQKSRNFNAMDVRALVVGHVDGTVCIFSGKDWTPVSSPCPLPDCELIAGSSSVISVESSKSGDVAIVFTQAAGVRIFDVGTGVLIGVCCTSRNPDSAHFGMLENTVECLRERATRLEHCFATKQLLEEEEEEDLLEDAIRTSQTNLTKTKTSVESNVTESTPIISSPPLCVGALVGDVVLMSGEMLAEQKQNEELEEQDVVVHENSDVNSTPIIESANGGKKTVTISDKQSSSTSLISNGAESSNNNSTTSESASTFRRVSRRASSNVPSMSNVVSAASSDKVTSEMAIHSVPSVPEPLGNEEEDISSNKDEISIAKESVHENIWIVRVYAFYLPRSLSSYVKFHWPDLNKTKLKKHEDLLKGHYALQSELRVIDRLGHRAELRKEREERHRKRWRELRQETHHSKHVISCP